MLLSRTTRRVVTALAIATSVAFTMPTNALADEAPQPAPIDAVAQLTPSIMGAAVAAQIDALGLGRTDVAAADPATGILAQARLLLENSNLPATTKATLESIITFLDGSAGGGPAIPTDGPVISQFLIPTIGKGCISATADSVGTALAVAGPATLPPPGPGVNQAGFVFTALGTPALTAEQPAPLTVTWLNIDNARSATQTLTNSAMINPSGPATLSAIADTGRGRVLALLGGSITTAAPGGTAITCSFMPTLGLVVVG